MLRVNVLINLDCEHLVLSFWDGGVGEMTNLCNHQANRRVSAALVVEMGTTPLTSNDQFSVTLKEFYHVKGGERK